MPRKSSLLCGPKTSESAVIGANLGAAVVKLSLFSSSEKVSTDAFGPVPPQPTHFCGVATVIEQFCVRTIRPALPFVPAEASIQLGLKTCNPNGNSYPARAIEGDRGLKTCWKEELPSTADSTGLGSNFVTLAL